MRASIQSYQGVTSPPIGANHRLYRAGMLKVLRVDFGTQEADAPGVAKKVRRGLHDALLAGEVIFRVAVKVPAESCHSALKFGLQFDVDPSA